MSRDEWVYCLLVTLGLLVALAIGGYPWPLDTKEQWQRHRRRAWRTVVTEGYAAAGGDSVTKDHYPYSGQRCPFHAAEDRKEKNKPPP